MKAGYNNICRVGYIASNFDFFASKDDKTYVIQVNVSVDTYKKRGQELANYHRIPHLCLFISPLFNRFLIKDFKECGTCRLDNEDYSKLIYLPTSLVEKCYRYWFSLK
jgi:hypothetical protein